VFTGAAAYNADTYGFFLKWMRDMRESQHDDGAFPSVAPFAQYGNEGNNFGWADAGVIVPWTMWRRFGDTTILKENWAAMEKFLVRIDANVYDGTASITPTPTGCRTKSTSRAAVGTMWKEHPEAIRYRDFLAKCHWLQDARM
jgi:alpha-L-rhamnosidase